MSLAAWQSIKIPSVDLGALTWEQLPRHGIDPVLLTATVAFCDEFLKPWEKYKQQNNQDEKEAIILVQNTLDTKCYGFNYILFDMIATHLHENYQSHKKYSSIVAPFSIRWYNLGKLPPNRTRMRLTPQYTI